MKESPLIIPIWEKNKKENDKDNKNSNNPWTYNNLSLFRYEFKTLFAITPESFCVTDAGSQTANVSFRIDLNSDRSGDDVALDYVLTGNNAEGTFDVYKEGLTAYDANDKVVVSGLDLNPVPENENEKKGTITVVKREVEYFVWKASFVKTDGELTGKETVSLTMQQGSGKDEDGVITIDAKETDRLDLNECPPAIDGLVENVEGVGVCLDDQTAKNATFTFDVVLTESLNKDQTYYFQFDTGNIDASEIDYTYTIGNSSTSQAFTASSGQFTIGTIENDEFPNNGEVTFLAKVESKEALKQTDSITLKLDTKQSFDVDTKFATASIDDFDNCVIDGLVDDIKGSGVCVDNDKANKATYTFSVNLVGSVNKDQVYYYEFEGNANTGTYVATEIRIDNVIKDIDLSENSGSFMLSAEQAAEVGTEFLVEVDIVKAEGVFDGGETLTLKLDTKQNFDVDTKFATANIDDFENCVIDGLVDGVTAEGVCIEDGSAKNAEFTFGVELSGAYNQEQKYFYEFSGNKDAGDYELTGCRLCMGTVCLLWSLGEEKPEALCCQRRCQASSRCWPRFVRRTS